MTATGDGKRRGAVPEGDGDTRRRLAIEIGMLAFLAGLALVFLAGAPS